MLTRFTSTLALLLIAAASNAAAVHFTQSVLGSMLNYSIDDQALTVTFQPFSFAVPASSVVPANPTNTVLGQASLVVTGASHSYNLPGQLPIVTIIATPTYQFNFQIDNAIFNLPLLPATPSSVTTDLQTEPFQIPVSGTVAALSGQQPYSSPSVPFVSGSGSLSGHWTVLETVNYSDGTVVTKPTLTGAFSNLLTVSASGTSCNGWFNGIQLGGYPTAAPLIGGPACSLGGLGVYVVGPQPVPLRCTDVGGDACAFGTQGQPQQGCETGPSGKFGCGIALTISASFTQDGTLTTGIDLASVPAPPAAWLFGSALSVLAWVKRQQAIV